MPSADWSALTCLGSPQLLPSAETDENIFHPEDHTTMNLLPDDDILGALFHRALSSWSTGKIEVGVVQSTPLFVDFENMISAAGK